VNTQGIHRGNRFIFLTARTALTVFNGQQVAEDQNRIAETPMDDPGSVLESSFTFKARSWHDESVSFVLR
jgi:hypothetical protein